MLRSRKKLSLEKMYESTVKENEYSILPAFPIPSHISTPSYAKIPGGKPIINEKDIDISGEVKTEEEIVKMKKAARLAAKCLKLALESSKEDITPEEIDKKIHFFIIKNNGYPAAVNFHGFPKSLCSSPNEVACHGIPNSRPLKNGDIISYDCTVYLNGFFGDCAGTAIIGNATERHKNLVKVANECVMKAIDIIKPGMQFSQLGKVITEYANKHGFSIIKSFCGHFIGKEMHLPPLIPHYYPNNCTYIMKAGQTFTIEPILCEGSSQISVWSDGWTAVTVDNGRCAQWEHTVLVTEQGAEILTLPD